MHKEAGVHVLLTEGKEKGKGISELVGVRKMCVISWVFQLDSAKLTLIV